jgi:hypothetical protein
VAAGLVRSLGAAELRRAFGVVNEALIAEIGRADAGLADRLAGPLRELTGEGPPRAAPPNPAHPTGPAKTLRDC